MSEPEYYNINGLSPLEAYKQGLLSQEEYKGFLKGNIIKYVVRAEHKGNPVEDLNKAQDYLNHYKRIFSLPEIQIALDNVELRDCENGELYDLLKKETNTLQKSYDKYDESN